MSGFPYRVVGFDWDDTLRRTRETVWRMYIEIGERRCIFLSADDIRPHWGKPYRQLLSEVFGPNHSVDDLHAEIVALQEDYPFAPHDGLYDLLSFLQGHDVCLGILTAGPKYFMSTGLAGLNLDPQLFRFIVTGDDTAPYAKPDPEVFEPVFAVLNRQRIAPGEMLYIGDSLSDYYAARAAGLDFMGVTTGLYSAEDFAEVGARSFCSLLEIRDFFLS